MRHAAVRLRIAVVHQAFHAAQAAGKLHGVQVFDDGVHGFAAVVFQADADHAAETAHLPFGQFVVFVRGQAGVIHAFDGGMVLQALGEDLRVFHMLLHADDQRFDAAQHEPAVHRAGHCARVHHHVAHFLAQCRIFHGCHAHQHVGMAAQVFGGGMEDDVAAHVQRVLQIGRGEGVVDADPCAVCFGFGGHGGDVHQPEQRIGRGFQPNEFDAVSRQQAVDGVGLR